MDIIFGILGYGFFILLFGLAFYFMPISGRSSYRYDKARFKAETQASRDAFNASYKSK